MALEVRVQRIAHELRKAISSILRCKVKDVKLAATTITEISLSKDLSYAKVYYTCLTSSDILYISKTFNKSKRFFRSSIAKVLNLRAVPKLDFIYDSSLNSGMEIEKKISMALAADAKFIKQDNGSLKQICRKNKDSKVEKLR